MNLTVIIANRNEKFLRNTIDSILDSERADPPKILVVHDGVKPKGRPPRKYRSEAPFDKPRGCQAARDWGIVNSTTDYVCVVDGHMDFERGFFSALLAHVKDNPTHIACGLCPGLDPTTWTADDATRGGASLLHIDETRAACYLAPKWRYSEHAGEAQCLMGASYLMRRDWYVTTLRRPWRFGTGWGRDEEVLSIATRLMGGKIWVVPKRGAHWFRDQKDVPYALTAADCAGVWANHIRIMDMFPWPEKFKREVVGVLLAHEPVRLLNRTIQPLVGDVSEYCRYIEDNAVMTTQELLDTCVPSEKVWQSQVGGGNRYSPCTLPEEPEPEPRKPPEANQKVHDPGIPCPKCKTKYGHKVANTYPNGNRRMRCAGCRKYFVAWRDSL